MFTVVAVLQCGDTHICKLSIELKGVHGVEIIMKDSIDHIEEIRSITLKSNRAEGCPSDNGDELFDPCSEYASLQRETLCVELDLSPGVNMYKLTAAESCTYPKEPLNHRTTCSSEAHISLYGSQRVSLDNTIGLLRLIWTWLFVHTSTRMEHSAIIMFLRSVCR